MKQFIPYLWKKENTLPIHLIFETTSICNSRCVTCFNWKKTDAEQTQLSLENIKKLLNSFDHQLLWLSFTGGECFLRKDLPELFELFIKKTNPAFFSIPTNGLLPDHIKKTTEKMLRLYKKPFILTVSLDGLEEMHDKIRGVKGNFGKALETYSKLKELKQKYPNLHLGVNTVLNSLNQNQLKDIIKFVRKLNPESHTIELMRGCSRDSNIEAPSLEFYETNKDLIKKAMKEKSYYSFSLSSLLLKAAKVYYHDLACEILKQGKQLIPCFAGRLSAVIDCKGNVYPCELYKKIGNLHDENFNFKELWFSESASKIRAEIKNKGCYCAHSCFQFVNILFNPKLYPKLLRYISP